MDRKALSLPILISLVVGNMIGTGIYVLPASLAKFGAASIYSWIFTSVGALTLALVFASMNKRFPKTGGPYVYCKEAFGKLGGFVIGYIYWASYMVSVAGIAVATTGYLGYIFPMLDANTPEFSRVATVCAELGIVWLFTAINLIGVHSAGVVQLILTIIKLIPLVLISLIGLYKINLGNLAAHTLAEPTNFSAISSAAAVTFWAFIGLESATVPAENTKGPHDIYIATVFGTLATGIIYIISTFVLMGLMPPEQLQSSQFPFAQAGTMLFGSYAALFVTLCAVASGLGTLNASILVQGQIVFASARDHMFPRMFAKLSKHDVPVSAQIMSSGLVTILLIASVEPTLLKQFDNIAMLASLLTLFVYFATTIAELKFDIAAKRSVLNVFRRKAIYIAILAAIYSAWMVTTFSSAILIAALGITAVCIPIYYFTVRNYV